MNNYNKIKQMSSEEMAEWLTNRDIEVMKQVLAEVNIAFAKKRITTRFRASLELENLDFLLKEVEDDRT